MKPGLRRKAWARRLSLGVCLEYVGSSESNGGGMITGSCGKSTDLSSDFGLSSGCNTVLAMCYRESCLITLSFTFIVY